MAWFIPARAGNTHLPAALAQSKSVHPRSRGEHSLILLLHVFPSGSSPLARGTQTRCHQHRPANRFIPARAGNTVSPRPTVFTSSGSSPLARGTQRRRVRMLLIFRFIPARAGNTRTRNGRTRADSVHPRSRGEHTSFNVMNYNRKITIPKSTDFLV